MKLICPECRWHGDSSELLYERNQFVIDGTITACPVCKAIDTTKAACDEPGCWDEVTCGTPVRHVEPKGYRSTCSKHQPDGKHKPKENQ